MFWTYSFSVRSDPAASALAAGERATSDASIGQREADQALPWSEQTHPPLRRSASCPIIDPDLALSGPDPIPEDALPSPHSNQARYAGACCVPCVLTTS